MKIVLTKREMETVVREHYRVSSQVEIVLIDFPENRDDGTLNRPQLTKLFSQVAPILEEKRVVKAIKAVIDFNNSNIRTAKAFIDDIKGYRCLRFDDFVESYQFHFGE